MVIRIKRYGYTNLYRAMTEDGEVYAVIGQVKELKQFNLVRTEGIEPEGTNEKWLVLKAMGEDISEFETLEEAKESIKRGAKAR